MVPLEQQHAMVAAEQARIRARVDELEAEMGALTRARRGEFDDDEHDPDGASLSSQWSMLAGLLESAREDTLRAEAAARRVTAGEYGICVACRREIPAAQLEARPLRERCVSCSAS